MDFTVILFVDFDGVLHPENKGAVFTCTNVLWKVLRLHPKLRVVISSSWRWDRTLGNMKRLMTANGGEDLADRIIGATPKLRHTFYAKSRQMECEAWLQANGLKDMPWIALDDKPELFEPGSAHLYLVDPRLGLTDADVFGISQRLRQ